MLLPGHALSSGGTACFPLSPLSDKSDTAGDRGCFIDFKQKDVGQRGLIKPGGGRQGPVLPQLWDGLPDHRTDCPGSNCFCHHQERGDSGGRYWSWPENSSLRSEPGIGEHPRIHLPLSSTTGTRDRLQNSLLLPRLCLPGATAKGRKMPLPHVTFQI